MTEPNSTIFKFGPFLLDERERTLLRDGELVPLAAKVFETLLLMVKNAGRAMEKETFIRALWPDTFVEEGNLTQNVSRLRKVLGDHSGQQYIETLPRRGYRFVAEVGQIDPGRVQIMNSRFRRARLTITEAIEEDESDRVALAERVSSGKAIAILPFSTLGLPPENQFLGLGLADALITQLGSTRQVAVRPTSAVRQFTDARESSAEIGRKLQVNAILEGSVQIAGDRVRLTVQLVGVNAGTSLWAQKFNLPFTDIFDVQDTIAEQVEQVLLLRLSEGERANLVRRYTSDTEAYSDYLRGRYFWNQRSLAGYEKAIEYFNGAIERDPAYALAFAGLADCHNMLPVWGDARTKDACPQALAFACRALELDESLAEAHTSLGYALAHFEWDFAGAETAYRRALELNPNYATAHQWYAKLLVALERFDEAETEIKLARSLDPLSLMVGTASGGPFLYARRYDEAIERFRDVLEIDSNFVPAIYSLGIAHTFKGMFVEAIELAQQVIRLSGEHPFGSAFLAATLAVAGRSLEAEIALEHLLEISQQRQIRTYGLALIYANLGQHEIAFDWLERSFQERDGHLVDLKIDPYLAVLREDPRYRALLRRVGFPE